MLNLKYIQKKIQVLNKVDNNDDIIYNNNNDNNSNKKSKDII